MTPEDVYQLTGATDPRLSPDGSRVAYVVWSIDREENQYRSSIWLVATDGSSPPQRFTSGPKRDTSPRWSPDGRWLAFLSNRETEKLQLHVIPSAGGEARRLTDLNEDAGDPRWSPDGTRIAFVSRVPDPAYEEKDEKKRAPRRFRRLSYKLDNVGWTGDRRQHVFVVDADGSGEPRQLTSGDYEDAGPAWSPDGSKIAFGSGRDDDWDITGVEDIHVVDAEGGEPTKLTDDAGASFSPSWSPDGTHIAYLFVPGVLDFPRHTQVVLVPSGGGPRRILTEALDRTCSPFPPLREPVWAGDALAFVVEDGGNDHLHTVRADGSAPPTRLIGGERLLSGFDINDGRIAFSANSPAALDEVFVAELASTPPGEATNERALTDVGERFASERTLAQPERFTATSKDGTEVEAWIIRPAEPEPGARYPVLLNVHGGPFTQYGNKFFDEFQVYAGAGYAVLYSNPRGSSGYSEAWGRAINTQDQRGKAWGTVDYEDVMAVIETALETFDFCDPDRVGILGGSYGGYMTSWVIAHSNLFKAACSERAVNHFVSFYGSSDIGYSFAKAYFGRYLWEDLDGQAAMSPATHAESIRTPLLILHSEDDLRAPIEQGEHLFATLRLLGREVEMVRFPSESHELSRSGSPSHRVARFEVILDWFDRHLKKD
jgi:dipeptidyl aminopeptidase/acylaminoacyl peptidase